MSKLENYKGTTKVLSGLIQKDGDFALVEAGAVQITEDDKRLDDAFKFEEKVKLDANGNPIVAITIDNEISAKKTTQDGDTINWGKNIVSSNYYTNKTYGNGAVSLGYSNVQVGNKSAGLGAHNKTYSRGAIAIGYNNEAGDKNEDPGYYGHNSDGLTKPRMQVSIGVSNKALGNQSIAIGTGTIAKGNMQLVLGKYNVPDEESNVIIGNGYDDGHDTGRSNLITMSNEKIVYGSIDASMEHKNLLPSHLKKLYQGETAKDKKGIYALSYKINDIPRYLSVGDALKIVLTKSNNENITIATTLSALWFGNMANSDGTEIYYTDGIQFIFDETVNNITQVDFKTAWTSAKKIEVSFKSKYSLVVGPDQPHPGATQTIIGAYATTEDDSLFIIGNGTKDEKRNVVTVNKNNNVNINGSLIVGDNNQNDNANTVLLGNNLISNKENQVVIGNNNITDKEAEFILSSNKQNLLVVKNGYEKTIKPIRTEYYQYHCNNNNNEPIGPIIIFEANTVTKSEYEGKQVVLDLEDDNGKQYSNVIATINGVWVNNSTSFGGKDAIRISHESLVEAAKNFPDNPDFSNIIFGLNTRNPNNNKTTKIIGNSCKGLSLLSTDKKEIVLNNPIQGLDPITDTQLATKKYVDSKKLSEFKNDAGYLKDYNLYFNPTPYSTKDVKNNNNESSKYIYHPGHITNNKPGILIPLEKNILKPIYDWYGFNENNHQLRGKGKLTITDKNNNNKKYENVIVDIWDIYNNLNPSGNDAIRFRIDTIQHNELTKEKIEEIFGVPTKATGQTDCEKTVDDIQVDIQLEFIAKDYIDNKKISEFENDAKYISNKNDLIIKNNKITLGNNLDDVYGSCYVKVDSSDIELSTPGDIKINSKDGKVQINRLVDPTNPTDAANKKYVDDVKPEKLSELENDCGYITEEDIPDVDVPTKMSELEQDLSVLNFDGIVKYSASGIQPAISAPMDFTIGFNNLNLRGGSSLSISSFETKIGNVVAPTASGDAANKQYVDDALNDYIKREELAFDKDGNAIVNLNTNWSNILNKPKILNDSNINKINDWNEITNKPDILDKNIETINNWNEITNKPDILNDSNVGNINKWEHIDGVPTNLKDLATQMQSTDEFISFTKGIQANNLSTANTLTAGAITTSSITTDKIKKGSAAISFVQPTGTSSNERSLEMTGHTVNLRGNGANLFGAQINLNAPTINASGNIILTEGNTIRDTEGNDLLSGGGNIKCNGEEYEVVLNKQVASVILPEQSRLIPVFVNKDYIINSTNEGAEYYDRISGELIFKDTLAQPINITNCYGDLVVGGVGYDSLYLCNIVTQQNKIIEKAKFAGVQGDYFFVFDINSSNSSYEILYKCDTKSLETISTNYLGSKILGYPQGGKDGYSTWCYYNTLYRCDLNTGDIESLQFTKNNLKELTGDYSLNFNGNNSVQQLYQNNGNELYFSVWASNDNKYLFKYNFDDKQYQYLNYIESNYSIIYNGHINNDIILLSYYTPSESSTIIQLNLITGEKVLEKSLPIQLETKYFNTQLAKYQVLSNNYICDINSLNVQKYTCKSTDFNNISSITTRNCDNDYLIGSNYQYIIGDGNKEPDFIYNIAGAKKVIK